VATLEMPREPDYSHQPEMARLCAIE